MKFKTHSKYLLLLFVITLALSCKNEASHKSIEPSLAEKERKIESLKDSIQIYHELINKAELSICDSNYQEAAKFYDSAFIYHRFPFFKDIYNFSLSLIKSDQNDKALKYCGNLIELGVQLNTFELEPFNKFVSDSTAWNKLLTKYDSLRQNYLNRINFSVRDSIEALYVEDQKNFCGLARNGIPLGISEKIVYDKFKKILSTFGYPNSYLIGAPLKEDGSPDIFHHDIIIRHYYQEDNFDLSDFFKNEVHRGKILPNLFISWDQFKYNPNERFYGSTILNELNGKDFYILNDSKIENKELIQKFNKNRKPVFMWSYEDHLKKLIFMTKHENWGFYFYRYGHGRYFGESYLSKTDAYKKINLEEIFE